MKKLIISIVILIASLSCYSQKVTTDANGNYVAVKTETTAKSTGKFFLDQKGNKYPVMESAKGKLYYVRTSAKGNEYKCYIKL